MLLQAAAIGAALTLAADVYAHKRTELVGGVNMWGYRGRVARERMPREVRVVFVGGTRAFGWGAAASETIPATVRWMISLATDLPGQPLRPIVDINLAQRNVDASSFASTLRHFSYLRPDYVCIVDDLGLDQSVARDSRIYRWTGYRPALPLTLEEKGMAWRYGSVAAGYGTAARIDTPLPQAAAGALLQGVGRALRAFDEHTSQRAGAYVESMMDAVSAAQSQAAGVVVAVGPATTPAQRGNLAALQERLSQLKTDTVTLVDLTSVAALHTTRVTLDGYNYNGEGRVRVAEAIAPVLLHWIQRDPATVQH